MLQNGKTVQSIWINGKKFVYLDGQKYVRNLIGQQGTISYSDLALETYPRGKDFTNEDNFVCDSSYVYDYSVDGVCTDEGNVVHVSVEREGTPRGIIGYGWVDVDDIDVDTDDTGL